MVCGQKTRDDGTGRNKLAGSTSASFPVLYPLPPAISWERAIPFTRVSYQEMPASSSATQPGNFQETTQRIVLQGVSWQTYKALLAELGDHRASRLAYDGEFLEISMPSDRHETNTKLLERMIESVTEELEIPTKGFRSTTLNREDLQKGAEPDSCYYIQNVDRIQGRTVDLSSDPPPDLVLEVDITNPSTRKLPIYRELGVPEIWRYTRQGVQIFHLQAGNYQPCEFSPTFPMISGAILNQFLQQAEAQDDTTLIRSWRKWIRGVRGEK